MLTKNELGAYLKQVREAKELSLRRVNELTNISYSHLNMIEHGTRRVTPALLRNLATLYGIDYLDLYEKAGYVDLIDEEKMSDLIKIPILGYVRAGIPIEAVEEILGYEEIPADLARTGDFFCLKAKGDSMFPYIIEDDIIVFRKQSSCESGEICVVLVNGDEATIKVVKKTDDGITLIPYNRMYAPIFYANDEVANKPVIIVGVFKELRRKDLNVK